jgi:hypothetical protein
MAIAMRWKIGSSIWWPATQKASKSKFPSLAEAKAPNADKRVF